MGAFGESVAGLPSMLRKLSVQNRSPAELRRLAAERREQASSQTGKIKRLLLEEARLLDFQAESRIWIAERRSVSYELAAFFAKVSSRMELAPADERSLLTGAMPPRHAQKGELLIEQEEETSSLVILCSGMARAVRTLLDGRQQIVAVFVAGDTLNATDLPFRQARNSISALTPAICLSIPLRHLDTLLTGHPAIARALWLDAAAQSAIQQEWMVGLGRHQAQARLAHFICEVSCRLQFSGSSADDSFEFPLTQRELGDTLGLSPVHVNRTLQLLRGQGLIELSHQKLTIRNKSGLYELAEFDPRYLGGSRFADRGAT
ncbi:Crp/Fnr family transcriptional regulator [Bradyrhizobium sp.]|uniref:Crp/Fnr family transcriptional regulator n=1 Tax=Bradyrhizobium sp. TaxID=376 RepID=UPI003C53EDEB